MFFLRMQSAKKHKKKELHPYVEIAFLITTAPIALAYSMSFGMVFNIINPNYNKKYPNKKK
jgi:hypothetical protein